MIDLHAHVVLEAAFETAGPYGPRLVERDGVDEFSVGDYRMRPCPYRTSVFMDVDARLRLMDRLAIDLQLLSPNPLTFLGGIEAEPAVAHARATNEAMAELVARHPDRLLGAAALPLQDPSAACAELERATGELGLIAAYCGTDYGFGLDDARLDEVYGRLVELDVPLLLHPATNDGDAAITDPRLRRFGLDLVLGYAYEETMAVASLVLGGVLERHPDLDVCISHGGGAIAFLAHRFDQMGGFLRDRVGVDQPDLTPSLRRLWYDSHVGHGPARGLVADAVGTERMVFGTNLGGWDTPTSTDAFDASLTPNAERLLRLGDQERP
ncbi:MAG: amidohydrolase family protein [Actinomycetota bacterium]